MEEETEYLKLPLEDRCVHKLWKARVNGYEECAKLFAKITDEKSPEFSKFAPLMKKFVTDSNVVAQEKALDAVLVFVENAHIAGKTAGEVTAGIVTKCLASPKRTTQEKALDVILMYCEVEKYEAVEEELIKGFSQKNPKVVCGCIKAISTALKEFGSKVISIKPLVKNMSALLEDRDKNVREETKKMVIEMYRWVGPALKPQLTSLKPIQVQELETEFDKMPKEKPIQTRFLRSQQELKAKAENREEGDEGGGEGDEDEGDGPEEIDPYDLMTPVNILEKLPDGFYEQVEAKKWQDRKKAVEDLHPLTQNLRLETGDYGDLVKALKKIIAKDTNVMIIALAGQCLCGIAKGLKKKFNPYSVSCLETIFEKFKEKKINVVTSLREASDAIFQSTNIEAIQEITCTALGNKNPNVKAETASFLARSFCYCTPALLSKKVLKPYITELLKTLNESDSSVRENSAEAIGTALKVVGEKTLSPFLADVDALKMQKVKEFSEKAEIKVKAKPVKAKPVPKPTAPAKEPVSKPVVKKIPPRLQNGRPNSSEGGLQKSKKSADSKLGGASSRNDIDSLNMNDVYDDAEEEFGQTSTQDKESRVNISDQITSTLISELGDKNWKVRMEALGKVSTMLNDAKFITGDIGELPDALCSRLNDTNKNIAAEALKITSQLGIALGVHGKQHVRIIIPGLFGSLGDTKKSMRDQALIALNDWVDQLNSVKDVIDGEMCIDALKSGSPFLKIELITWLSKKLREAPPKSLNKEELNGCVTYIYSGMEDRNVEIRKASNEAIFPFMLHLGYDGMAKHAAKVKPSSKNTVMQALEKAKPNLPARPPSSTQGGPVNKSKSSSSVGGRQASAERGDTSTSSTSSAGVSAKGIKKGIASRTVTKGSASSRKEEEVDTSPLLQVNNMKQQRQTEEQRMRTLRWDFATPRPEFVSQLKDQMSNAGLNRVLLTNMFHQDFKFHIKAIDALVEDLYDNVDSCISNLDLVLRWLTIRFFDTNPSVILKAMDYLSNVFTLLLENEYHLTDYEAYSFLPFLIMKFGDPKDAIRGPTKSIIKLICNIYPASKVSPYILDGLKSKNARQRAECLETMGSLIEDYGMTVCQPSPPVALKEVAKQIADRDSSVRNAALNCLLQVYIRQGEKVYKLIGQISDKDHSLLEERIKRAAKSKPVIKMPAPPEQPSNPSAVRGGAGTAIGRPNRVIPTPAAQPAPLIRDGRIPQASSVTSNENRDVRKKMNYYNPYKYYGSCDELEERYLRDNSLSDFAYNKLGNRFSSMCNLQSKKPKPYRKKSEESDRQYFRNNNNNINNTYVSSHQIIDDRNQQSEDNYVNHCTVLPQLRIPKKETASFERAKRISRSLSHILGEAFEQEESLKNNDDRKDFVKLGLPLTSLSRMATSPQFSGFGQRPLSGEIGNRNSRFQIDFDFIEKLIEGDGPSSEGKKKYKLEEIPDIDSALDYEAPATLPTSRLTRPGFTSAMRANVVNANVDMEDASQAINMVISQVATTDVNTVITALSQLDEVIESEEKRNLLSPHIDQLLIVARFQYRHVLNTKMSDETINKEECIRIYRSLTSCLMSIFNNKELGTKASRDVLRDIIHVIINILLDSKLSSLEDGPRLVRALNVLVVRIIEKAQFTNIFSALLKLLQECVGSGENPKFTELVMKCNWKAIRILPSRCDELNPVQILQDAHDFMTEYPSNTWAERPSSTPIRTIKTVLHTLVKEYGSDILKYLSQVPNIQGSELQKYVIKDLNTSQKSSGASDAEEKDSNKVEVATSLKYPKKTSKSTNNTLSEIFRKIGSKENTTEGLVELYEFKQKNPDVDIDSYLKKSSQFFQNYIERGLKKVELERQGEYKLTTNLSSNGSSHGTTTTTTTNPTTTAAPLSSIQVKDAAVNELVDQFRAMAAKAGFDNTYIDSAVKDIYNTDKK